MLNIIFPPDTSEWGKNLPIIGKRVNSLPKLSNNLTTTCIFLIAGSYLLLKTDLSLQIGWLFDVLYLKKKKMSKKGFIPVFVCFVAIRSE